MELVGIFTRLVESNLYRRLINQVQSMWLADLESKGAL